MSDSFYHSKVVLVTGGTGFVGTHFVEHLLKLGAKVRVPVHLRPLRIEDPNLEGISADLCQEDDALRMCEGIDYLVHCAGATGGVGVDSAGLMGGVAGNIIPAVVTFQAAWKQGVKRLLLFSSSTGYPALDHPVKEDEFWTGDVYPGYLGYGWMRRYMECLGQFIDRDSETRVTLVRPTATYGPHDNFDSNTSHVIPGLIRRAMASEDPFVVWGSPKVVRDFLYVKDLVHGSLLALEKLPGADPVNIGYGREITIQHLVESVLQAVGYGTDNIIYDESKPTALPFRLADTSKAKRLLGFEPTVTLEQGLAETVAWYKRNVRSQTVSAIGNRL
ncbi:NAD-dependent epimerase/dehydratase family protein [Planctomycetota bacterium]